MRRHLALTMTLLGALLLGALLTVAVAWGCRYMAQLDRVNPDNGDSVTDATLTWAVWDVPPGRVTLGGDDRVYLTAHDDNRFRLPTLTDRGWSWNDCGVDWVAVAQPFEIDASLYAQTLEDRENEWMRRRSTYAPSEQADDWPPADRDFLPPWSRLDRHPLDDHVIVIENASGWPFRALVARHFRPESIAPGAAGSIYESPSYLPWIRHTTGAAYGMPTASGVLHQVPYGILWRGFMLNTLIWGSTCLCVVAVPLVVCRSIRTSLRRRARRCPSCGHRLDPSTNPSDCTECGASLAYAPRPWRAAAFLLWTGVFIHGAALLVYAIAVTGTPECSAFERAAARGDVDTMRELAAEPSFQIPRGDHGAVDASGIGGRAGLAAHSGDHGDALRFILELEGITAPTATSTFSSDDVLRLSALFDRTTEWATLCRQWNLLDASRFDDGMEAVGFITDSLIWSPGGFELLYDTMSNDVALCRHLWPWVFAHALIYETEVDARRLLTLRPPGDLDEEELSAIGRSIVGMTMPFRTDEPESDARLHRTRFAREIAERISMKDGQPRPTQSVLTGAVLWQAFLTRSEADFRERAEFFCSLPFPPRRTATTSSAVYLDPAIFKLRLNGVDIAARWRLLAPLGISPNIGTRTASAFSRWAEMDGANEPLLALLDLGAVVTDHALTVATPKNAETIRAWLDEHGGAVYEHREVYPNDELSFAQLPDGATRTGSDDDSP